ncbi:MAG: DUF1343 domain-containing protein [Brumimicrobium sp.]|nr:DUF1343 domain-containing protein [Brumimicrobium sp.]
MYSLRLCLKSFFVFFLLSCQTVVEISDNESDMTESTDQQSEVKEKEIIVGARRIEELIKIIDTRTVGIVANQTSLVNETHLVDSLLSREVSIRAVFSPEHGFRGSADAGEEISSDVDTRTGLPIISLYGSNKKPKESQLEGIELMIFDLQDVGARFYTYISTLHYVMQACAEMNIPLIILDRPNPNGQVIDGPVLKKGFESFVGMHPIPVTHAMTIGEYGKMINGQGWLGEDLECELQVLECLNYAHYMDYSIPVPPSPNLRSDEAISLYPSLCFFEGTIISVGRGTDNPFEIFGHPELRNIERKYNYVFVPTSGYGAKSPKLEGEECYGKNLVETGREIPDGRIRLDWLIDAYNDLGDEDFFENKGKFFDKLAGSDVLRRQIIEGQTEDEIRESWEEDINKFKRIRKKYLLYD